LAATRQRHSDYFASVVNGQRARLEAGPDHEAIATLDREIENIRAAWAGVVAQGNLEPIAAFVAGLWLYYEAKGWFQEAVFVLTQVCSLPDVPNGQKASWYRWLGEAHYQMGHQSESRAYYEAAMALLGR